ncbi:MAG: formylmethanofuran dehydrogenase subunit [Eubacteriales bacterium]|nr:formylmethanofuran dehydrogenase subunit [Eubacteriales bacterium]MDN5364071.1 formylmethanofuran dehydrogenase subunit [Eubacteriales bacterium]
MTEERKDWEKVVAFHGHSCPGLAVGFRAARIALRELAAERDVDEELVAVVENDACGVDAVQVLTGCTFGKGNLWFRDYGKHVFTFFCRNSGRGVRIAVKGSLWREDDPDFQELREKVFSGTAEPEEKERFRRLQEERTRHILTMPEGEFCTVQAVQEEIPPKAKIFRSLTCAFCGEQVAEHRARWREGRPACIPCAQEPEKGCKC